MGFLGFLISIQSIKSLYFNLCGGSCPIMKFLLTYKLPQDHLQMFLSAVRSKGGYNNNPTIKQFKSAYIRLLCHHDIMTSDNANCISLDETHILNVSSARNKYVSIINSFSYENNNDDGYSVATTPEVNVCLREYPSKINYYISDIVGYISGFVVKKLEQKIKCEDCIIAIRNNSCFHDSFLSRQKCTGGLINPATDVVKICKTGERHFRVMQASGKLKNRNIMQQLLIQTIQDISSSIFYSLNEHSFDQSPLENHRLTLIKAVLFEYFKVRLYHVGKQITEKLQLNKVRNINNKTTLFLGQ